MANPYKNLVTNSLVFTLANFGSKIITFLMVPLYTYVLTPDAYGTIDIVTTTSGLMIPIVFLCISDAVMRYTMSSKFLKKWAQHLRRTFSAVFERNNKRFPWG